MGHEFRDPESRTLQILPRRDSLTELNWPVGLPFITLHYLRLWLLQYERETMQIDSLSVFLLILLLPLAYPSNELCSLRYMSLSLGIEIW